MGRIRVSIFQRNRDCCCWCVLYRPPEPYQQHDEWSQRLQWWWVDVESTNWFLSSFLLILWKMTRIISYFPCHLPTSFLSYILLPFHPRTRNPLLSTYFFVHCTAPTVISSLLFYVVLKQFQPMKWKRRVTQSSRDDCDAVDWPEGAQCISYSNGSSKWKRREVSDRWYYCRMLLIGRCGLNPRSRSCVRRLSPYEKWHVSVAAAAVCGVIWCDVCTLWLEQYGDMRMKKKISLVRLSIPLFVKRMKDIYYWVFSLLLRITLSYRSHIHPRKNRSSSRMGVNCTILK